MRAALTILMLGTLMGTAWAAAWQSYEPAFPKLPCMDGWAACEVGDALVTPGGVTDGAGRLHPADQRIGFFAFDPLPSLSPFSPFARYGRSRNQDLAAASPPARGGGSQGGTARPSSGGGAADRGQPDGSSEPSSPVRIEPGSGGTSTPSGSGSNSASVGSASQGSAYAGSSPGTGGSASGSAASTSSGMGVSAGGSGGGLGSSSPGLQTTAAAAPSAIASRGTSNLQADPPPVARTQDSMAVAATSSGAGSAAVADVEPLPPGDDLQPVSGNCDDWIALEAPSMMGQLGAETRAACEAKLASTAKQTDKSKVSRLLIADALARGDKAEWERLMKRHLEDIDRSDPNLCLNYAIYLATAGAGKSTQVIRWSDYALENKQQWSGAAYTKNVYGLFKLRAQAANRLWQAAETDYVKNRTDEAESTSQKTRGMAKDYAKEWLDYARVSGQETTAPLALCVSASGNQEFCE